ncbi:MAG: Sec-independent protein translocase protein TatB [Caulobacteraceae bacterium]
MFPEGRILDFAIVGAIALIVVGPKDLPVLMRKVGAFVARMRAMAAEFRSSFDEMARQSELDELRREVKAIRSGAPLKEAVGLGEDKETRQVFDEIHADLRGDEAPARPAADYEYPAGAGADAAAAVAPSPDTPPPAPPGPSVAPT